MKRWQIELITGVGVFVLGLILGHFFWFGAGGNSLILIREKSNDQPLINPIISCDLGIGGDSFTEMNSLKDQLNSQIYIFKQNHQASAVSIYFRRLNAGRWFEINGEDLYRPASLLKVMTAIATMRYAEDHPGYLNQYVTYHDQVFNDPDEAKMGVLPLQPGGSYQVSALISRLLTYSDNGANNLLIDSLPDSAVEDVGQDLNINPPEDTSAPFMSGRIYSLLFRVLYNASYLNSQDSEHLLEILSNATFTKGLVAGVPSGVKVAHKFGLRTPTDLPPSEANADNELHDCGIVYYSKHPYFLCVMTRGDNQVALEGVIKTISQITYEWVDNFWQNQ